MPSVKRTTAPGAGGAGSGVSQDDVDNSIEAAIDTLSTEIDSDIASVTSSVSTLSTNVTSLTSSVSGLSTTVAGKADDSAVIKTTGNQTKSGVLNFTTQPTINGNNIVSVSGSGTIDSSLLPSIAITDTFEVASQSAMLLLSAQPGDVAIRSDLNKSFILSASPPSTLSNWKELLTPTDSVLSVDGATGAVSLTNSYAAKTGPFSPTNANASTATRYVGGTTTAAPTAGTWVVGDWVMSTSGAIYVCTTAGTPGTWESLGLLNGSGTPIQSVGTSNTPGTNVRGARADHGHRQQAAVQPIGITGTSGNARFCGSTTSGAPSTGTFSVGDYVIAQDAHIFICTVAGSPGTWVDVTANLIAATLVDAKGDLLAGTADNAIARRSIGATGQWLAVDSADSTGMVWKYPRTTVSATSGVTADYGDIVLCDATSAAFTVTLPAVAANRRTIDVKKTDSSANAVTISPASGTIDGSANYSLPLQNQSVTLTSNGTNWFVI